MPTNPEEQRPFPNAAGSELTRGRVVALAVPLIIANATTPLLGLVDTFVLGRTGTTTDLAAISLGALVFNILYWSMGFLRMTTTGFVAQAEGARDDQELVTAVARPALIGLAVGVLFFLLQSLVESAAFSLLGAGFEVEGAARDYFRARITGAPGALIGFAGTGALIGLGHTRHLLGLQVLINGLNMALDVWFVVGLGLGVSGVGWGTAISEWFGGLATLAVVVHLLRHRTGAAWQWGASFRRVFDRQRLVRALWANSDVMLRTITLIAGFSIFTDCGARLGDATLAANYILLQFVSLSAFFLDGYAHVAEAQVGSAVGARDVLAFDRAVRRTTEVALVSSAILALLVAWGGRGAIDVLTVIEPVRQIAHAYLLPAATYIGLSVFAFQLDGIFIGAVETRRMRNAAIFSLLIFVVAVAALVSNYANSGLWWAFVCYVVARGASLGALLPRLRSRLLDWPHPPDRSTMR